MALSMNITTSLVSSTDATGTQTITDADGFHKHQFAVTIGAAGTVTAEWSSDGTRWAKAADAVTATDTIYLDGTYPRLRLSWAGNTGTITIDHVASDESATAAR